jgi:hypothetical protein
VTWRFEGDFVQLGEGRRVPNRFTVTVPPLGDEPEVRAEIEVRGDGVPECRDVRVVSVGAGRRVRARDLRAIKLDDIIEAGFGQVVWQPAPLPERMRQHGVDPADWVTGPTPEQAHVAIRDMRQAKRRRVLTDEVLEVVAEVYRANVDRNPTQAVREHFGCGQSTASLYVKLARDRGFLGAALKGRAGEK